MRLDSTSPLLPLARVRDAKPAAPSGGMWRCTQRTRFAVSVSPTRIASSVVSSAFSLAERAAYEHHTIIRALPRARRATLAAEGESRSVETSSGATFAAFDAAMADVERVLARMETARE